jgi:hypothetical protein
VDFPLDCVSEPDCCDPLALLVDPVELLELDCESEFCELLEPLRSAPDGSLIELVLTAFVLTALVLLLRISVLLLAPDGSLYSLFCLQPANIAAAANIMTISFFIIFFRVCGITSACTNVIRENLLNKAVPSFSDGVFPSWRPVKTESRCEK